MGNDVSGILVNRQGDGKGEVEEPDWLKELSEDDGSERAASESSEDPFAFLSTPSKSPLKNIHQASEPGDEAPGPTDGELRSDETVREAKTKNPCARISSVIINNPDKASLNRLLVELPHKDSDAVDLSGDTGAVGRFTFTSMCIGPTLDPHRPLSDAEPGNSGCQAAPLSVHPPATSAKEDCPSMNSLVLDLKGVKFSATIAGLAGTACVVNIGQNSATVEAVFNEFVQLEEASLFEEYEELTGGNFEAWTLTEPNCGSAQGVDQQAPKKQRKSLLISSGRVAKSSGKGKAPSKSSKSRASQRGSSRKR